MVYIGEYPKNPNTQGWEQFNASKSAMLSAFDQAIVRSKGRKVQTEHGRVAEAEFRKWLSDFTEKVWCYFWLYNFARVRRLRRPLILMLLFMTYLSLRFYGLRKILIVL